MDYPTEEERIGYHVKSGEVPAYTLETLIKWLEKDAKVLCKTAAQHPDAYGQRLLKEMTVKLYAAKLLKSSIVNS